MRYLYLVALSFDISLVGVIFGAFWGSAPSTELRSMPSYSQNLEPRPARADSELVLRVELSLLAMFVGNSNMTSCTRRHINKRNS